MQTAGLPPVDRPPPQPRQSPPDDASALLRRSEPRESMILRATIRRPGGVDVNTTVRNLSPGGMMTEAPSGFVRGDRIEVELRGIGIVSGKVIWMVGGRLGVQFDRPVDHRLARVTWWP